MKLVRKNGGSGGSAARSAPREGAVASVLGGRKAGALKLDGVGKTYHSRSGAVVAVENCSLETSPGDFVVVVGPSGCGKTTLLNAIAGFDGISAGSISLDGELLCGSGRPCARPGADRLVVFQNGALFPWKTTLENVVYGPVIQGRLGKKEARDLARARMQQAGLLGLEDRYPGELSSGMARRVEIVRALVNEPKVLLLDEPFRGLDSLARFVMHEALLKMYDNSDVTVFFITHDIEEAVFLGSTIIVMSTRPASVKDTISVPLPRPRDHRMLTSTDFQEVMARVVEGVQDEARKAFEAGERELA